MSKIDLFHLRSLVNECKDNKEGNLVISNFGSLSIGYIDKKTIYGYLPPEDGIKSYRFRFIHSQGREIIFLPVNSILIYSIRCINGSKRSSLLLSYKNGVKNIFSSSLLGHTVAKAILKGVYLGDNKSISTLRLVNAQLNNLGKIILNYRPVIIKYPLDRSRGIKIEYRDIESIFRSFFLERYNGFPEWIFKYFMEINNPNLRMIYGRNKNRYGLLKIENMEFPFVEITRINGEAFLYDLILTRLDYMNLELNNPFIYLDLDEKYALINIA